MMGHRAKLNGGGEWDCFTHWRRWLCYLTRAGVARRIKARANRRYRREAKAELRSER